MICPVHTTPADAGIIRWTPTVGRLVALLFGGKLFGYFLLLFLFSSVERVQCVCIAGLAREVLYASLYDRIYITLFM